MYDPTEAARRKMVDEINVEPGSREALEKDCGKVWDTSQLQEDFDVIGFLAPFVQVVRKSDAVGGLLKFQHSPRFYFSFQAET